MDLDMLPKKTIYTVELEKKQPSDDSDQHMVNISYQLQRYHRSHFVVKKYETHQNMLAARKCTWKIVRISLENYID